MAKSPRAVAEAVLAKLDDGGSGMIASKPACVCRLYPELKFFASAVVLFFLVLFPISCGGLVVRRLCWACLRSSKNEVGRVWPKTPGRWLRRWWPS